MDRGLNGLLQLYAGEGEETYLAPLGMGLRAWGHGFKSCLLIYDIDIKILETITPILGNCRQWLQVIDLRGSEKSDSDIYVETIRVITKKEYDIVMLGGLTNLLHRNAYQKIFLKVLEEKGQEKEIVFIGTLPPKEYLDYFALITNIQENVNN